MGSSGTFRSLVSSPASSPTFSCSWLDSLHGLWTWVITCHVHGQRTHYQPTILHAVFSPCGMAPAQKGFVHAEVTLGSQFTFPYTRVVSITLGEGEYHIGKFSSRAKKSFFLQNCATGLNNEEGNNNKAFND